MSLDIPKWIADIYYKVDKNHDGITQDEIDNLDRAKEGIGSIYKFNAGMNLEDFVNQNKSIFAGYIHFDGEPENGRQVTGDDGNLVKTNSKRNISKDTDKSIEVLQGEYSIATASNNVQTMQTYGIGPCVAVTIYDKTNKKGFLTHIDTKEKAKSLTSVLSKVLASGFDVNNCEARIIGGQTGVSVATVKEIQKVLENKKFKIVEMDVLGDTQRSIQLDLNTGEVTDYEETVPQRDDTNLAVLRTLYNNNLTEYKPPKIGL